MGILFPISCSTYATFTLNVSLKYQHSLQKASFLYSSINTLELRYSYVKGI